MLASLCGTLLEYEEDHAVVDVNGLRFRLEIPASTASQLPAAGGRVELYTELSFNANDGNFALYGFATKVERDCFEVLNTLTGIGPRKALSILSQIEIGTFASAIVGQNLDYLSRIKGVGRKTAERLLVELREKMVPFVAREGTSPAVDKLLARENIRDAVQGLMALGTRPQVAEKAIRAAAEALGEEAAASALIREGLKRR